MSIFFQQGLVIVYKQMKSEPTSPKEISGNGYTALDNYILGCKTTGADLNITEMLKP